MFKNSTGYNLSDIAAVTGRSNGSGDGMWGDGGWWIILLFLFAGWGNNGNGWGGNGGGSVREEVAYGFDINNLENGIRGIQQGLCDGFYAMNTGLLSGFGDVQSTLCQGFSGVNLANMQNTNAITAQLTAMASDNAACCCETQRALERGFAQIGYDMATQACDTRRAIQDSTKDILDFLTQDKIASLQAENQTLKFAASQQAQNAYLINHLSDPCPVPAYVVPNPNCCYPSNITFGFQQGCGCSNNGYFG